MMVKIKFISIESNDTSAFLHILVQKKVFYSPFIRYFAIAFFKSPKAFSRVLEPESLGSV